MFLELGHVPLRWSWARDVPFQQDKLHFCSLGPCPGQAHKACPCMMLWALSFLLLCCVYKVFTEIQLQARGRAENQAGRLLGYQPLGVLQDTDSPHIIRDQPQVPSASAPSTIV